MDVNAAPPNRKPRTATLPDVTEKSADPRLPTIPASPGNERSAVAVLLPAAKGIDEVPIIVPELSRTVTDTDVFVVLGFTTATAVV
jgi:hypothetical protein